MRKQIKSFISVLLNIFCRMNQSRENSNVDYNNNEMPTQSKPQNYNFQPELISPVKPDLFLKIESIMSQKVVLLWEQDTLADAYFMATVQGIEEIFVVDKNRKFIGMIKALDILEKLPPSLVSIPINYRQNYIEMDYSLYISIRKSIQKTLKDSFDLNKQNCLAIDIKDRVIDILDKLSILYDNFYDSSSLMPVISQKQTLVGTISTKSILKFIINYKPEIQNKKIKFIEELGLVTPVYYLSFDKKLVDAYYAFLHLPISCLLTHDIGNQRSFGMIENLRVFSLVHSLYPDLLQLSLKDISLAIPDEQIISIDSSIEELINRFIYNRFNYIFVGTLSDGQTIIEGIVNESDLLKILFTNN